MYPFSIPTGLTDGGDAVSMALLQQHQQIGLPLDHSVVSQLSAQQARGSGRSMMESTLSSLASSHGLSASELMSASSLQDRERIMSTELLKHRWQHMGHQEQLAAAMALASRNQVLSKQQQQHQDPQEDLILKRALSQLTSISRQPLNHRSQLQSSHQPMDNTLYCAEQNLSMEKDICFGRGQRVQRRKANVAFRKIVATYQETYDQAVSREDKKAVVKKVSRIFSRTGYRFFKESEDTAKYANGSKLWSAVLERHVEYKIGHSFRSGRKQLKQQKNQRKEKEGNNFVLGCSNEVQTNKNQACSVVANEPSNHSVYKEDELSDKCICIGDKREKYTGMEAYQYFRELSLTFKSIFGMTESIVEKTKIVSGLIEQIKSNKGYKFLKLMPLKKDVEFWIEASTEEISCEVFCIVGDVLESNEKKLVNNVPKRANDNHNTEDELLSTKVIDGMPTVTGRKNQKRSFDDEGNASDDSPKKRLCLLPDRTSEGNCVRPAALKRTVTEPLNVSKKSALDNKKGDAVDSLTASSTTKMEEKGDSRFVWKKGRKRTLPKKFVPSEIVCESSIDNIDRLPSENGKPKIATDPFSKLQREAMSAIAAQGMRIPSSLVSSVALSGNIRSLSGENMPMGNRHSSQGWSGRSTLEKALHAMRPSLHRTRERVENANLEAAKHMEMKEKLLQQLRQQELLYIEKKHKLAMLDLQMRSRNGGI